MYLNPLTVEQASHLIKKGALPIDIREDDEIDQGCIPGGVSHPLSALPHHIETDGRLAVFYCKTGVRALRSAPFLSKAVDGQAFMLHGGISAWLRAGLPVTGALVDSGNMLSFAPGEAYRFDWSHEQVFLDGVPVSVKLARVRLCYSRMLFLRAYPRETPDMVFDAHERAFAFFRGACACGIYDTMSTASEAIFAGKEPDINDRFNQMCNYYQVEPVIRPSAAGTAKIMAEEQQKRIRREFFVPKIMVNNYAELNALLVDKCIALAKAQIHPDLRDRTIWECFLEERSGLLPQRSRFDSYHALTEAVANDCLVPFDNNRYSVAAHAIGGSVEVRAYAGRIVIRQGETIVGIHDRCFGKGEVIYDPWHYLSPAVWRVRDLAPGKPMPGWLLPANIARVRNRLQGSADGSQQMVAILSAVAKAGLGAVNRACGEALAEGMCSADAILNRLAPERPATQSETIKVPEALRLRLEPMANCNRYDTLRRAS